MTLLTGRVIAESSTVLQRTVSVAGAESLMWSSGCFHLIELLRSLAPKASRVSKIKIPSRGKSAARAPDTSAVATLHNPID